MHQSWETPDARKVGLKLQGGLLMEINAVTSPVLDTWDTIARFTFSCGVHPQENTTVIDGSMMEIMSK